MILTKKKGKVRMTVMKQRHKAAAHALIQATAREKWMPPSVYVALLFFF